MIRAFLLFVACVSLMACGQNNSSTIKGGGATSCQVTQTCGPDKLDAANLMYLLSCKGENPSARLLTGTSAFKLENNTVATIDLFFLNNSEYELSYLEHDATYLGERFYQVANPNLWKWALTQQNGLVLLKANAANEDDKVFAQGTFIKTDQSYELNLKFNQNLGRAKLANRSIKFVVASKGYGRETKPVSEICKLNPN